MSLFSLQNSITFMIISLVIVSSISFGLNFIHIWNSVDSFCYSKGGFPSGKANLFFANYRCSFENKDGTYYSLKVIRTPNGWGLEHDTI